jgi:putative tryptophan/tyrosine transport system substrate-binding protein
VVQQNHRSQRVTARRALIAMVGGAALTWPLGVRAQQDMPVIGLLSDQFPEASVETVSVFRKGLAEQGFVEGRNVSIEFRWASGDYARVPDLAADLVRRKVTLLVILGSFVPLREAMKATTTIPIVAPFIDPVVDTGGRIASVNHPGGNVTGAALFTGSANVLDTKRLDFLVALLPGMKKLGILAGALTFAPISDAQLRDEQAGAEARGLTVTVVRVKGDEDFEPAFALFAQQKVDAVLESPSAFFHSRRDRLVALAAQHRLPAIWEWPDFVEDGGLMSYGSRITDTIHQLGVYAGRILKGEKPADLPVVLPSRYYLIINLKTAKSLGLAIPPNLLAIADDVIE